MKILQVASHPPSHLGGHEAYAFRISKALVKIGHSVDLLVAGRNKSAYYIEGIRVIQSSRLLDFLRLPIANAIPWLMRSDADIIHGHSYVFPIILQSALISKMKNAKFLLHLHGGIQTSGFYKDLPLILKDKFYDPTLGRLVGLLSDGIASVSRDDLAFFRENFKIPYTIPGFLLENFVDLELIDGYKSQNTEAPNFSPSIMFAGRFVHEKGCHLLPLIDRLLKTKWNIEFRWNVAGDGPLRSVIQRWVASDPERIRYHGLTRGKQFFHLLENSDVVIIPSIVVEGMPTICLEALACNTPVVGFNSGGIADVILEGINGFLATVNDIEKLSQYIVDILTNSSLRNCLGENGRKLVETHYSVPKIVQNTIRAYSILLKS